MSIPLLPSERAQASALIDGILLKSDMATISASVIRKTLQGKVQYDLGPKKQAIKALINERFDYISSQSDPSPGTATNGGVKHEERVKQEASPPATSTPDPKSEPNSDLEEASPPKKKRKSAPVDEDAKLAAQLQAQENRSARATRGGNKVVKKKAPKKPRKKSEAKVKADDDSEIEVGSDGEVKEKVKKGGFHKEYLLSAPLADLVGASQLSRPQTVKKIWMHIKANGLQDPSDKRQIQCDEKMQLVFKQETVHMFTMNKLLGKHLYDLEE